MMQSINCCPATLAKGYKKYSPKALRELFDGIAVSPFLSFPSLASHQREADILLEHRRISISGAQEKYSLRLSNNQLMPTSTNGEYILKPISQNIRNATQVPANEHLTMQIARQLFGIRTAACAMVFFKDEQPAYLTKRFDYRPDGTKYRQEDFASIANQTGETDGENYKYRFSYEMIARLMRKFVVSYQVEIEKYYKLLLFNCLFSNGDAHLKNFSLIESDSGDFILSPAYDLLNTRLHGDDFTDLAAEDGFFENDFETESYQANAFYAYDDFLEFGRRVGIVEKRVKKIVSDISAINKEPKVRKMIYRSFLDSENKEAYHDLYQDKLKRFRYSFLKQII